MTRRYLEVWLGLVGLFLSSGVVLSLPAQDGPISRGVGWTLTRLDLEITLRPEVDGIEGRGVARLRLDDLAASYGPTLAINRSKPIFELTSVTAPEGATLDRAVRLPDRSAVRLVDVRFPEPLPRGTELELSFEMKGHGSSSQLRIRRDIALASWGEFWYPVPVPRLDLGQGFTSRLGAAPGRTTFHLPLGWIALSDGALRSRESSSNGSSEVWEVVGAVARSFSAGPYTAATETVDGRQVHVYLLGEKPLSVKQLAALVGASMRAQEARLGPFPYPSYGVAEVPNDVASWYAASQQSFIMAKSAAFELDHGNLPLWAHEMAHAWWGNLVASGGPGSKWVSESLAQLGAVLAIEAIEGEAARTEFLDFSRSGYSSVQSARGYFGLLRQGKDIRVAWLNSRNRDQASLTHNLADSKGVWIYHMLRRRVGDELFFTTLRGLIERFAGREMTAQDVRSAFLAAAPAEADLEPFFSQWLDRTGAPVLELEWTPLPSGKGAKIVVRQEQSGDPYRLWLDLALKLASGAIRIESVRLEERSGTWEVETDETVEAIELDPDHDLLIWRPEYGAKP